MKKDSKKLKPNRAFIIRNEVSMPLLEEADSGEDCSHWLFKSGESFHGEHDKEFFYFKDNRVSGSLKLPLSCVKLEFGKKELKNK